MADPIPSAPSPVLTVLPRVGRHVQLRPWTLDDVDTWRRWQEPGHRWHRTDGPYFPRPGAEQHDQVAQTMRTYIRAGATTLNGRRLVVADLDGAYLGTVSRYPLDGTGWTAVGVALHDDRQWGRGLGRDALGLWVDVLFESFPELHRLDARTWSGHGAMCRVAEACGFTLEGRFREARVVDGERHDGMGYGILRSEWAARRA